MWLLQSLSAHFCTTLYIQQAPATITTINAPSIITNTDTSSTIPNQEYVIKPMNTNRVETNSRWLNNYVIFCDTDMRNHTFNCDTVVCETNTKYQTLPHAVSHTHHFHSFHFTFPRDGFYLGCSPVVKLHFMHLI